jgi:hypothetical protein
VQRESCRHGRGADEEEEEEEEEEVVDEVLASILQFKNYGFMVNYLSILFFAERSCSSPRSGHPHSDCQTQWWQK